jgi:hypothetical protein
MKEIELLCYWAWALRHSTAATNCRIATEPRIEPNVCRPSQSDMRGTISSGLRHS